MQRKQQKNQFKYNKKTLLLVLAMFFSILVFSKEIYVTQAYNYLDNTPENELNLDSLMKHFQNLYSYGHFEKSFDFCNAGADLAKKQNDLNKQSLFELHQARCYNRFDNSEKAILFGRAAVSHYAGLVDEQKSFVHNVFSKIYDAANLLDSALYHNYLSDSLILISKPENRYEVISTRSDIYEKQGLFDLAVQAAELSVEIVEQTDNTIDKLRMYYDVKELCAYVGLSEKYGQYTKKYLDLYGELDSKSRFHKGTFDLNYKSLEEQIEIMEKVADDYKNSYYLHGYNLSLQKLTKLYIEAEDYSNAYRAAKEHEPLILKQSFENSLYQYYERRYLIEKKLAKLNDAIVTSDILMEMRDTLQSLVLAKQSVELEEKYKSQAKDQEITILNQQSQVKDLKIQRSNITKWLSIIGSLLLLLFSYYLYRNVRSKKRVNTILADKNTIIEENLLEKETLLKEIHHRVKNNLQIISSLLRLQSRSISDPGTKEALLDGQNRVQSMALIHQNLYQENNLTGVEVKQYFENLCQNLLSTYQLSEKDIKLKLDISPVRLDVSTLIPMGLIVNELFTNSLKYAFTSKDTFSIGATLTEENDYLKLVVYDNGLGIDEELKAYLNGESTRTRSKKWGFGTRLLQSFAQKLEADITAENSEGTKITLHIKNYKIV